MINRINSILAMLIAMIYAESAMANSLTISSKVQSVGERAIAEYKKPLKLNISENGINRISFAPNIITNIWGDSSEYSASLSNNGSELFLTSKLEAGNNIALAVALAGGRIIDLVLATKKNDPSIIHLNLQNHSSKIDEVQKEAGNMLKAMRQGIKGKYYVQEYKNSIEINSHNVLQARHSRLYQFGDLIGIPLHLKNKSKGVVEVDIHKLLRGFSNVIALQIDHQNILPNMETKAYLVVEKGSN